jgi:hypothetical protein
MTENVNIKKENIIHIQDGCRYPEKTPWSPMVTRITSSMVLIFFLAGVYGTFKAGFFVFLVWVAAFAFKLWGVRYIVCARCPYYGEDCSCFYGRFTAHFYKKQENKSMKMGLWIDLFVWAFIFLFPLYHYLDAGMDLFALFWCSIFAFMFGSLSVFACSTCPFEFCPQGFVGRWVGKIIGVRS